MDITELRRRKLGTQSLGEFIIRRQTREGWASIIWDKVFPVAMKGLLRERESVLLNCVCVFVEANSKNKRFINVPDKWFVYNRNYMLKVLTAWNERQKIYIYHLVAQAVVLHDFISFRVMICVFEINQLE